MNKKNNHAKERDSTDRIRKVVIFCAALALGYGIFVGFAFAADGKNEFQQANDLYKSGKFDEAAALYEKAILHDSLGAYPELHFNLANARFRAGKTFDAIYHYERALTLNPWYADARFNLNAAKVKIEYKIEDRRNPFIRFNDFVLKWVKPAHLWIASLIFSLFFLISSSFWLKNSNSQLFWSFPRTECFSVFLLFVVLLGCKLFYIHHYAEAIILVNEAEVRYGPSMDNQSVMKLGGGLKVFIVDSREDWSRVLTWNNETGWMRNSELGKITS